MNGGALPRAMDLPVGIDEVRAAAERVRPHLHRTPVITNATIDEKVGAEVHFKMESLQKTGSFKARGATNAVARLSPDERQRGVVTHSSGNHAQALAFAAKIFQVPCTVVMPKGSSKAKRDATEGYGAHIIDCDDNQTARETAAAKVMRETGAVLIHPYDNPHIIAGQGTAALELLEEVRGLDHILAPVGGGGLLAGTAIVANAHRPQVGVIGCEPAGADDAFRSLGSGKRITEQVPHTIADGLRTTLGQLNFDILHKLAVPVRRVREEEIVTAMKFAWERTKQIIEPSSAVPLAVLLHDAKGLAGKRIGVIVTGGNVDTSVLFEALEKKIVRGT